MEIFDRFDRVNYNGKELTNILRKAKIIKGILDRIDVYYEYIVKDGEEASAIAFDYYGSPTYTWLVYMANEIYDPYFQWPLTSQRLEDFVAQKYGDRYLPYSTIDHYKNDKFSYTITPYTFSKLSMVDKMGWLPVTQFEKELEINETKRRIKLVSNQHLKLVQREIGTLFNGSTSVFD